MSISQPQVLRNNASLLLHFTAPIFSVPFFSVVEATVDAAYLSGSPVHPHLVYPGLGEIHFCPAQQVFLHRVSIQVTCQQRTPPPLMLNRVSRACRVLIRDLTWIQDLVLVDILISRISSRYKNRIETSHTLAVRIAT
jgi:hypothetical protein